MSGWLYSNLSEKFLLFLQYHSIGNTEGKKSQMEMAENEKYYSF